MKQFDSKLEFTSFVVEQVYSNIKFLCANGSFDSFCFTLVKSHSGEVYVYAEPFDFSSPTFPHAFSFACCLINGINPIHIFTNILDDVVTAIDVWLYDWFLEYDSKIALNEISK